ncbi:MAG: sensor histidine kinase [Pseudomonadota bacterium]
MTLTRRALTLSRSVRVQLLAMLSVAILPLGIIAVFQTRAVVSDALELERQDILSRTVQAAAEQRAILQSAFGAAAALGTAAVALTDDDATCDAVMADFVQRKPDFAFAGFIGADGVMRCVSRGDDMDFSDFPSWQRLVANPKPMVEINASGTNSGMSVMIASVPMLDADGTLLGVASVSLPHSLSDTLLDADVAGLDLALIDYDGRVLSASGGIDNAAAFESLGIVPQDVPRDASGATVLLDNGGNQQVAALVPYGAQNLYFLGLWSADQDLYLSGGFSDIAALFPILMWVAALVIAFMALDRLMLRHLKVLRRQMVGFSPETSTERDTGLTDPPSELRDIERSFDRMITRIVADRQALSDTLSEKDLLLREVHHRVKNNLQLIVSILNMQMRHVGETEASRVLQRVQDRVMSLSVIHKVLYTGNKMSSVRADRLLDELVRGSLAVGLPPSAAIKTDIALAPLELDPDQAIPLSLLANETITNALKNIGRTEKGDAWLHVSLEQNADQSVRLCVENSIGTLLQDDIGVEGTGLGSRLIDAFAMQLGGELHQDRNDEAYRIALVFKPLSAAAPEQAESIRADYGALPAAT